MRGALMRAVSRPFARRFARGAATDAFTALEHKMWQAGAAAYSDSFAKVTGMATNALLDNANVTLTSPMAVSIVERTPLESREGGLRVLDVATGPGMVADAAAARGHAEVVALDFSSEMIKRAQACSLHCSIHPALSTQLPAACALQSVPRESAPCCPAPCSSRPLTRDAHARAGRRRAAPGGRRAAGRGRCRGAAHAGRLVRRRDDRLRAAAPAAAAPRPRGGVPHAQAHVLEAATLCVGGCNPMLQTQVLEAAALCARGCSPMYPSYNLISPVALSSRRSACSSPAATSPTRCGLLRTRTPTPTPSPTLALARTRNLARARARTRSFPCRHRRPWPSHRKPRPSPGLVAAGQRRLPHPQRGPRGARLPRGQAARSRGRRGAATLPPLQTGPEPDPDSGPGPHPGPGPGPGPDPSPDPDAGPDLAQTLTRTLTPTPASPPPPPPALPLTPSLTLLPTPWP